MNLGKENKKSQELYDWFKAKYNFGELGLFECIIIASLKVTNLKYAVSTIVIAPAGEAKTDIMRDVNNIFENDIILKEGIVSEYWIIRNVSQDNLNEKAFCIGDMADSIKAMQGRRVNGMLAFFKNIIDGHAQIQQANTDVDYRVKKTAFIINVPQQAMSSSTIGHLISTTFFDRTIPFQFATKWEEWSPLWIEGKLHNNTIQNKMKLKSMNVEIPKKFRKEIVNEANFLRRLKLSGLPRNIHLVQAFLTGNALLNGRKKISGADFLVWNTMKQFIRW